jgi:hypothetical protein
MRIAFRAFFARTGFDLDRKTIAANNIRRHAGQRERA